MTSGPPGDQDREPRSAAWRASAGRLKRLLLDQRSLFLIVGMLNTLFSTLLFICLVLLFGPGVPSVVSLGIAWLASLMTGFFAHRMLVFRVSGNMLVDLLRYASVNYLSLLINAGALFLLSDMLGLPPIPVQIAIVAIVVVFTYVGHKHFSFRRKA